jgi:hypothetical protein
MPICMPTRSLAHPSAHPANATPWLEAASDMRSVVPTTPLEGTDSRQGRVPPSVGDHPKTGLGVFGEWSVLQHSDDFLDGIQGGLFRPVASRS